MKRRATHSTGSSRSGRNHMDKKGLSVGKAPPDPDAPAKQQQLKLYEEALKHFQAAEISPRQAIAGAGAGRTEQGTG